MMRAAYLVIILIAAGILTSPCQGVPAPQPDSPAPVPETSLQTAPVTVDGSVLFPVRGLQAFPAEERANRISALIAKTAQDESIRSDAITIVESELSTEIVAAGRVIMAVLESDARSEGVTRQELAKICVRKIREAVERYREDRSPREIWLGVLRSAIATVVLMLSLLLIRTLFRRLLSGVSEGRIADRIGSIRIQSFVIVRAEQIKALLTGAARTARLVLILVLFYIYTQLVLGLFPWTRPISNHLLDFLLVPLATMGRGFLKYTPNLIFLGVLVFVTKYLLKLMRLFFDGLENGTLSFSGFYPDWARPTYKLARFLAIAFMAVVAFPYIPGSDSPAFKGVSIFLGVILSLGSSSVISNTFAGLTMTYRRAFRVGDRVKIGDFSGDVTEMRLLVTHLLSLKNEEIIVPNSVIFNSHVVNYSSHARKRGLILHTSVTIGYNTPWRQIHALLLQAAAKTPGLLSAPSPFILQTSLDDFYVSYELNAYTDSPQAMMQIYSDLHQNIQDAFNEYGVQIMSPHYMLDPKTPAVVPRERWYEPPAEPPQEKGAGR
ncbi:MAG TPA: mechanosensitive ion channel family protein [Dongiaceae bacterium]|nr:mechanosensitive ion channel family protein [Dongiaceae bacterium]